MGNKTLWAGVALGAMTVVLAGQAAAQTPPAPDAVVPETQPTEQASETEQAAEGDRVVVTGSLIARRDYVSNSPIVTVPDEFIAASGSPTLETTLNQLPQFAASASSSTNTTARGGQASLNLRGLGQQRTLVLLNGRRLQPASPDGSIDLNVVPTGLIGGIEIITGGASAIYGSDAVAGVVNLKLRNDVEGVEVSGQYGVADVGDGKTYDFSLLAGSSFADDRGRAVVALGYSERDNAPFLNRPHLMGQVIVTALPTATINVVSTNLPSQAAVNTVFGQYGVAPGAVARTAQFLVNTDGSLFVTPGRINYRGGTPQSPLIVYNNALQFAVSDTYVAQTPLERYNFLGDLEYDLSDDVTFFVQGMFTDYTVSTGGAFANAGSSSGRQLIVPVTNPFITPDLAAVLASRPNPTAPITISRFTTEMGSRKEINNYSVYQLTAGLSGKSDFHDLTWSIYASAGTTNYRATELGYPSTVAINTLLSAADGGRSLCAGGWNPFGFAPISEACAQYVRRDAHNETTLETRAIEATASGVLFALPAGDLSFAIGADYRKNSFNFSPDALIATGELANFLPVAASNGSQSVSEVYGELLIPILKDAFLAKELSIDLGARHSEYDVSGPADTYKADISWEVISGLRLRGGYSRAIRAPSVGELFAAAGQGQTPLGAPGVIGSGDPCDIRGAYRAASAPNAAQVRALCLAQGIPAALIDTFTNTNPRTPFLSSGNANLEPEQADTYSIGLVIRPEFDSPLLSDISVSIDAYSITLDGAIGLITNTVATSECFNPATNTAFVNTTYFCQLITRDPANGQITQILNPQLNLASYKTSGIDFQADWRVDLADLGLNPGWGSVSISNVTSYLESFEIQNLAGARTLDYAGTIGNIQIDLFASAHPTWKATTTFGWKNDILSANLRWRFLDAMENAGNVGNTGTAPGVADASYFDLDATWSVTPTVDLRFGVVNALDKKPPVLNRNLTGVLHTDPYTYDLIGRRYYVGVKAKF